MFITTKSLMLKYVNNVTLSKSYVTVEGIGQTTFELN
jgi:hypothetical protein